MIPTYDKSKYFRILDRTQSNYNNQLNRLTRSKKRASIIVIYYSISLIFYALAQIIFSTAFNHEMISFTSVALSVIILVYSIINEKANYPKRIDDIRRAMSKINTLKRKVGEVPDPCSNCSCPNIPFYCGAQRCIRFDALKSQYTEIVNNTEYRDNIDFYYTIYALCKKYGVLPLSRKLNNQEHLECIYKRIEDRAIASGQNAKEAVKFAAIEIAEIKQYMAEIGIFSQVLRIIAEKIKYAILYAAPAIVLVVSLNPVYNQIRVIMNKLFDSLFGNG